MQPSHMIHMSGVLLVIAGVVGCAVDPQVDPGAPDDRSATLTRSDALSSDTDPYECYDDCIGGFCDTYNDNNDDLTPHLPSGQTVGYGTGQPQTANSCTQLHRVSCENKCGLHPAGT